MWATGSTPWAAEVVTVRARITALALVVSSLVLVLAGAALLNVLGSELTSQGDAAARARVAELVEQATAGALDRRIPPVTDDGFVQVLDRDGTVLASSPNLPAAPVDAPATAPETLHVLELTAPDDDETERYRTWRTAVETDAGTVTVLVGTSLESATEATGTLRTALTLGIPLMLALLGLGTWYVVGRALGRVDRVRAAVERIPEDDLSRRLEPGSPDEVGRLVETMNRLLARVDDFQRRQRDFVADASHELQSPLTAFRAQLEVAQAHPESADWHALTTDLLEDTDRMEELVHDLLLLAVGETPRPDTDGTVDVSRLVDDEVARLVVRPDVSVRSETGLPAEVRGDRGELGRVVANLLENAVTHAASQVTVNVTREAGSIVIRVVDDGPGVPADQVDRVFERFFRGDAARSRADRGTGLGLAIARTLSRRHGGDVVLVPGTGGTTFEVRLPRLGP